MFSQILKISLENVLTSTGGKILIAALVILCFLIIVKISKAPKENSAKTLAVCGLLLATAIVLGELRLFKMPLGGSVTPASMLPVILAGYFYGSRQGILLGSSAGIFKLLLGGATILNPFQVVLDYVAAKGIIGASGFFKDKKHGLIIGGFVGILGRYIVAVISGYIFFAEYVPVDFQHSALVWSLYYNITYLGVDGAITLAVLILFEKRFENLREAI